MANSKGYVPKGKLGTGTRFSNVSGSVSSEYVKKGYSAKKAAAIGAAVAASAGREAHGTKQMARYSAMGKK